MSKCEQFTQVPQDKWANCSAILIKSLIFSFIQKKWAIRSKRFLKIHIFCTFCTVFEVFFKKQKIHSFLLSEMSELLRSVRTNDRQWAICSGRSEGMSDREGITKNEQITHFLNKSLICSLFEWITHLLTSWANCSFLTLLSKPLIRSIVWQKRLIHSKIRWSNSQPWKAKNKEQFKN